MPWLVVIGVLVAALSLRGPVIAVTPVLPEIITDLGIGSAAAGLLTTAPVLMFGAITPVAALVIRRAGAELALLASLSGVLIGTLVRALPGYGAMLTGMLIIGAGITIGNVVIPVIIRRDLPPERAALGTALYTATLNAGSLATASVTAPLAEGLGWSPALLLWSSFTGLGLILWVAHIVRSRSWGSAERGSGEPVRHPAGGREIISDTTGPLPVIVDDRVGAIVRRPIVWLLLCSFGLQSAMYYGLSTWLPTMLIDRIGATASAAGAMSSVFQGAAIAGALIAPVLLRFLGAVPSAVTMGACWMLMALGLLFAPELAWLWSAFGAIGHSAGFVIVFTALVRSSRSDAEAATMSALVQGAGYLLAASGAPVLGALNEASGGWQVPLTVVAGMIVVYTSALVSAMVVARRPR
ncbi:MFS transporter [Microbacterium tumbae]